MNLYFFYKICSNIKINIFIRIILFSFIIAYFTVSFLIIDNYDINVLIVLLTGLYIYSINNEIQSIIIDYVNDDKSQTLLIYLLKIALLNLFIYILSIL